MTNPTPAAVERLIADAEAALEGVTPGEWKAAYSKWEPDNFIVQTDHPCRRVLAQFDGDGDGPDDQSLADARFIAWARNNVPALLAALRAMQAECNQWRVDCEEFRRDKEAAEATVAHVMRHSDNETERANRAEATVATLTAQVGAMRGALIAEREENLWNAYHTGIERDGRWSHAFMSDGEWLARECGFDAKAGDYPAEAIKAAIPEAAKRAALTTENQTND